MTSYIRPPTDEEKESIELMRDKLKDVSLDSEDTAFRLDDQLFVRFLRQKDGNVDKAVTLLTECIEWRKTTKPYKITFESVAPWATLKGASMILGETKNGIPVCHLHPISGMEVNIPLRVNYVIFLYEELMRRGYYEMIFVGDFGEVSMPTSDEKAARTAVDEVRGKYYPLFDSKVMIVNMPFLLRAIFAVMVAFMSAAQKEQMHSGLKPSDLLEWIAEDQLPEYLGGKRSIQTTQDAEGNALTDVLGMMPPKVNA